MEKNKPLRRKATDIDIGYDYDEDDGAFCEPLEREDGKEYFSRIKEKKSYDEKKRDNEGFWG